MSRTYRVQVQLDEETVNRMNRVFGYGERQRILEFAIKDVLELLEKDRKVKYFLEERKLILGEELRPNVNLARQIQDAVEG